MRAVMPAMRADEIVRAVDGALSAPLLRGPELEPEPALDEAPSAKAKVDDAVNHPAHYRHPSGVECIQITEHMGFNLGNAVKYLWRAGQKENAPTVQDLRKAVWYIEREIAKLEKEKP